MQEMDKKAFGLFLAQLRKERGWTQRQLAEKLHVSDKTVSKWERGIGMPDIGLLNPLADVLGVTVTELLNGTRLDRNDQMNVERVEQIVSSAIQLSGPEEFRMPPESRRKWGRRLALGVAAAILEVLVLRGMGFSPLELAEGLALVEGLCILFAVWMCLFVRERLPVYYDEHRISFYSDGVFRMNLAGMRLHNGNWPHILNAGRRWLIGVIAVFPALYGVIRLCLPESVWVQGRLALYLAACLGLFVPMFVAGKRHES